MPRATASQNTWWLAGTLYVAYNVTGSIPFLSEMERQLILRKKLSGVEFGRYNLMLAGLLLNLPHCPTSVSVDLEIPNLTYLI